MPESDAQSAALSGHQFADDEAAMQRAIELAKCGLGNVEPNPLVGAVITDANLNFIAEGFHPRFGGPHAEIVALSNAGPKAAGATIFVTLEPCSHFGKTPPCADALVRAKVKRVVIGCQDPAPHVSGAGIRKLHEAGIDVQVGVCEAAAMRLISPFVKLQLQKRPYVHAKWAMTLDGKIASRTGLSKWISNEKSRAIVHQLRGLMDAIVTGIGTVLADDPLLTPRPAGHRIPTRVVLDSALRLPLNCKLVQSARDVPLLVFTTQSKDCEKGQELIRAGVEVLQSPTPTPDGRLDLTKVLDELGRRNMTNIFLEAGGNLLGSFFDKGLVDELHCFIAPKLIGGSTALSPVNGLGLESMEHAWRLSHQQVELLDGDIYVRGVLTSKESPGTDRPITAEHHACDD